MLNILLNALMVLGILVAIILSAIVLIVGGVTIAALISKIIDIWKGGKPKNGGQ